MSNYDGLSQLGTRAVRIAWFIAGDEDGGVAQAVRGLMGAARSRGIEPLAVSIFDGPFLEEIESMAARTESLQVRKPPSLAGSLLNKARLEVKVLRASRAIRPRLAGALSRLDARIVHVVWPNLMPIAARAAHDAGAACIWEMPNILGRYPLGINRRLTQRTVARWGVTVLANSRFTASTLGVRPVKPLVCYLGADETRFFPNRPDRVTRKELGIPDDACVFGVFARLSPEKGQGLMLEALAGLPSTYSKTHILFVGGPAEGEVAALLRRRTEELGLSARVHMTGVVPDPERYYDAVDVAVNPRIDAEPFGFSVVEAMLMSRPTLVHALGGPAETVIDGTTGWHVNGATEADLRAGLLRALEERARWSEMGNAARECALSHFCLSRQAERYLDVVQRVLSAAPHKDGSEN